MYQLEPRSVRTDLRDVLAGFIVFLISLPFSLGIAIVSDAPITSGLIASGIGGLLVGLLSRSPTSISGASAGLTGLVAIQITKLGSFEALQLAIVVAGTIQILFGLAKAGFVSAFFPSSVIRGLIAAVGIILILKQLPHVLGHDTDPEGEMSFFQPDHENTFSELLTLVHGDFHDGAFTIGVLSVLILVGWDRISFLKKLIVPSSLLAIVAGILFSKLFSNLGDTWSLGPKHLVQLPLATDFRELSAIFHFPNFSEWLRPEIYFAGFAIAVFASLESLINLQATDELDPHQGSSPANRELIAQGIGNFISGLIGGLPIASTIERSSVNLFNRGQSRISAITYGSLVIVGAILLPTWINAIPIACLAAILLVTGWRIISSLMFKELLNAGRYQAIPFFITLIAIVFSDLSTGAVIGLVVSLGFILNSNFRRPLRRVMEKHLGGDVLHIHLANQVSFFSRGALEKALWDIPAGGHVLVDASATDYIDPDVLGLIRDFRDRAASARNVQVSLRGFREKYQLADQIQFVDFSTRDVQEKLTPRQIIQILEEGNERFRTGQQLTRDYGRQVLGTSDGQHPIAVVLSCIDSRSPAELILDLGLGDIFSVRVAGNILSPKVLGSMEYATAVVGAKLVVVLGHTRCGAVTAAVKFACTDQDAFQATGCQNLEPIIHDIQESIDLPTCRNLSKAPKEALEQYSDEVVLANVRHVLPNIMAQSSTIRSLVEQRKIALIGAVYDVVTGKIDFLINDAIGLG